MSMPTTVSFNQGEKCQKCGTSLNQCFRVFNYKSRRFGEYVNGCAVCFMDDNDRSGEYKCYTQTTNKQYDQTI